MCERVSEKILHGIFVAEMESEYPLQLLKLFRNLNLNIKSRDDRGKREEQTETIENHDLYHYSTLSSWSHSILDFMHIPSSAAAATTDMASSSIEDDARAVGGEASIRFHSIRANREEDVKGEELSSIKSIPPIQTSSIFSSYNWQSLRSLQYLTFGMNGPYAFGYSWMNPRRNHDQNVKFSSIPMFYFARLLFNQGRFDRDDARIEGIFAKTLGKRMVFVASGVRDLFLSSRQSHASRRDKKD